MDRQRREYLDRMPITGERHPRLVLGQYIDRYNQQSAPDPAVAGMIPLTVPETGCLLAHPPPPGAAAYWLAWRRRHQARATWYRQRTWLARDTTIALVR